MRAPRINLQFRRAAALIGLLFAAPGVSLLHAESTAAGDDWWSLQPLEKPALPEGLEHSWSRNEIDRFVLARLKANDLSPAPQADPRTLVRRLYFDLLGLPAPPEVIARFAKDPAQAQWRKLIDQLLASPHYGERWARHWLDVARFGETNGYEYNVPRKTAWHYRDWVIKALNKDLPYDEFARMQIAGDILKPGSLEGAAAVGFLVAGIHNTVLGQSPAMKLAGRHEELEEMAGTVAQTFLGLTVNCARCHDHKFDPISTREYYGFISALDGVTHGEREVRTSDRWATQRKSLQQQVDELQARLTAMVTARDGLSSTSANQLELREPVDANESGKPYRVSLKIAPSVWASPGQATGLLDGIVVRVLRNDGSVLATRRMKALPWDHGKNAANYLARKFDYEGDGSGAIRLKLSPYPLNSNRFGGAIDDVRIAEIPTGRTLFEESFDRLEQHSAPGSQAHTRHKVFHSGTSKRWKHSGTNAIHSVEHAAGNFALQLFGGGGGKVVAVAQTGPEKKLQGEIDVLNRRIARLPSGRSSKLYTVVPGAPKVMRVLLRGDVTQPGEEIAPAGLKAVQSVPASFGLGKAAPDARRRESLARWISHRENGPFHRVAVNRVWHHHFGSGIVPSPNDFGFNGGRPSHPDLLDWLAHWFREDGYSLKNLHRLILLSATYQQSSQGSRSLAAAQAVKLDSTNRLLWRQNPRRIDAETLRDSMLDVAGVLNSQQFGPGYEDVRMVKVGPANYYFPIDPVGPAFRRRTIYRWQARGQRSALLETFDCPDPSITTPARNVTTTPSQALSQWNDPFVLRMSEHLAKRLEQEAGASPEQQIDRAWKLVLGRSPDKQEAADALALIKEHGVPLLARVLFNSNEWIWIE